MRLVKPAQKRRKKNPFQCCFFPITCANTIGLYRWGVVCGAAYHGCNGNDK